MDISKVKLRIKKPGPDGAEENSTASKLDSSSSIEEDLDMDEDNGDEDEGVDSSPINLSIRKSSRPGIAQPVQSEAPDKVQKKSNITAEKQTKLKDKMDPEKKVTTRQKRTEKVNETPLENGSVKDALAETITAAVTADNKAKRRVKKLPAEKTAVHEQAQETDTDKDQMQKSDHQRSDEERVVKQKVERKRGRKRK